MNNINKKSFILLNTLFVIIFMMMLLGTYIRYSTTVVSMEFHKDLVKIRGYWAVYGAKESESNMIFTYFDSNLVYKIYDINVTKTTTSTNKYTWDIINTNNTSIKNDLIFTRVLTVNKTDNNKTISYK